MRRLIALALAVAGALALATPARALFHVSQIDEAMSGITGDPTIQFVEVRELAFMQNFVSNSVLTFFDCSGTPTVLLVVPANVPNGSPDDRWVMASSTAGAFVAAFGVTPDFTFPGGIDPACGNVCWGAPGIAPPTDPNSWDHSNPNNYVDCLAYGGYAGPMKTSQPVFAGALGDGVHSATRNVLGSTYLLMCPTPENNAGTQGGIAGCINTTTSTTTSSTTTTVPPPPVDQLITGAKLSLKDDPTNATKKKAVATSKDTTITLGLGNGSIDDPRTSGATVRIVTTAGDAFDESFVLPANGPSSTTWFLVGKEGQNLGYKYKDSLLLHGPVKALAVKTGKQLKLTAKGSGLTHTLVANPNPVDVVVTMGSARYCQRYGGTVVFKTPTSFTAKLAPAPSACP